MDADAGRRAIDGDADLRALEETMNIERIDEKLSMDETANPELVSEPAIVDLPEDRGDTPSDGEARLRDEHGRFVKSTGEQPETPADTVTPADNPIPEDQFKGYLTEKRKRQELEAQIAAMQQQMAQFQQPPTELPDFWQDPQTVIKQEVNQAVGQALTQWQQQQEVQRINASEAAAKAKYPDYDEAFGAFRQTVAADPELARQMMAAPDPGEFAYQKGKAAITLSSVGSLEAYEAQLRAKWEAELKAQAPRPSFPASTAADGSVAGRGMPAWAGPVADKDILPMG